MIVRILLRVMSRVSRECVCCLRSVRCGNSYGLSLMGLRATYRVLHTTMWDEQRRRRQRTRSLHSISLICTNVLLIPFLFLMSDMTTRRLPPHPPLHDRRGQTKSTNSVCVCVFCLQLPPLFVSPQMNRIWHVYTIYGWANYHVFGERMIFAPYHNSSARCLGLGFGINL